MEFEFIALNWHLFLALIVIIALIVFDSTRNRISGVQTVSAVELPRLINHDDAVVIDVCESAEYRKGHIAGAINIPVSQLREGTTALDKFKKKKRPIVVTCQTGSRSGPAAAILKKNEFAPVYTLTGGIAGWQKENFPVEKS